jgi:glycosyltransferase involved in cell wall biosynthesis
VVARNGQAQGLPYQIMESKPKILFVYPFANAEAKTFVESLAAGMGDVRFSDTGFSTLFLQLKKFDIVHFFLPATRKPPFGVFRKGPKTRSFQTILNSPEKSYKKLIFTDHMVVFSKQERSAILEEYPEATVVVIPPCTQMVANYEPSTAIREKYDAQDRLLVIALNDFSDQAHFTAFLYTVREYNRRGGFRFVIPVYRQDKQSLLWRSRLAEAIQKEKLHATTMLDAPVDVHSLIDAADFTLLMDKRPTHEFGFPLLVVEALCAGKPVLCYNVPPVNEIVSSFRKDWIANVNEDFSRMSRDLLKEAPRLEQISTDLSRFAQSKMSVKNVAQSYWQLYNES